jgi:hypothetical protein
VITDESILSAALPKEVRIGDQIDVTIVEMFHPDKIYVGRAEKYKDLLVMQKSLVRGASVGLRPLLSFRIEQFAFSLFLAHFQSGKGNGG